MKTLDIPAFRDLADDDRGAMLRWLSEHGCYDVAEIEEQFDGSIRVTCLARPHGKFVLEDDGSVAQYTKDIPNGAATFPWPT